MSALPLLTETIKQGFLKCPLCSETYTNPMILPCLHSACQACIRSHLAKVKDKLSGSTKRENKEHDIGCPVCIKTGKETLVSNVDFDNLQPNHFLSNLVDLSECQSEGPKTCDYCKFDHKSAEASHRCLECQDNLCAKCVEAHHRTKVTRFHKVAPFIEMHLGKYDSDVRSYQQVVCSIHQDEPIKFFCGRCELMICRECKVSSHENHHCSDLPNVCDMYKTKAKSLVSVVKCKLPNINVFLDFLNEYTTHLTEQKETATEGITQQAETLHKLIDKQKAKLIREVNEACQKETELANERKAAGKRLLQTLQSTTDYMDILLDHGKPEEILSIREIMLARISELGQKNIEPLSTKLSMTFSLGHVSDRNLETLFGKVNVNNVPLNNEFVKDICKTIPDELSITTVLPPVGEKVELIRTFECRGSTDTKDIWPTGLVITRDDRMVILDRENKRVKFFSRDGKFMREFGQGELGCPYDIALMKNGNLAITDYDHEDVKIFTQEGSLIAKLKGPMKYPRGICVDSKGNIIIVDAHGHKLVIHESAKGKVIKVIEGKDADNSELFNDPYYVTTNKKDQIIITDWIPPNVKIFTADGKCLIKYGTYGIRKDQCLQPYGVCTDQYGYIYVADNQNHRIHQLAPDGKFVRFIITKEHSVWHPMAIAINSEGQLVVTEALGKVKTFRIM